MVRGPLKTLISFIIGLSGVFSLFVTFKFQVDFLFGSLSFKHSRNAFEVDPQAWKGVPAAKLLVLSFAKHYERHEGA
jgi:hypothetical protein